MKIKYVTIKIKEKINKKYHLKEIIKITKNKKKSLKYLDK